jgi:hypothetical protein
VQTKIGSYQNTFALSPFLFFSFFLSKLELDHHHFMSTFIVIELILLYQLGCTNLAHITTHDKG